ncbi:MAG: Crp/Fnr family transcriptional regulator [Bacteroidota bacterium]
MHEVLLNLIHQKVVLSEHEIAMCTQFFEPVLITKNQILEKEGEVPGYLYFIASGFVRLFHYNDQGDEVTTHINCPPGFLTSYSHFVNQTKANEIVECITNCELLRITKKDLDYLTENSSAFKSFSIWVFQQAIAYNETRARELAILTAEQRYRKLIETYPAIIQHVPVRYIASFLGMKPESLSRIRRQMIN